MYYLYDSDVMLDFQGMSQSSGKECLSRLAPDWKYTFGKIVGVSGETRIGVQASQNWDEDRSSNHTGPFMVTASIAGAHLGSGVLQCGSLLAQDLGLIRTRPEKKSGVTKEVV